MSVFSFSSLKGATEFGRRFEFPCLRGTCSPVSYYANLSRWKPRCQCFGNWSLHHWSSCRATLSPNHSALKRLFSCRLVRASTGAGCFASYLEPASHSKHKTPHKWPRIRLIQYCMVYTVCVRSSITGKTSNNQSCGVTILSGSRSVHAGQSTRPKLWVARK